MDFNRVVSYYELISSTSKRLEITKYLADLFKECINEGFIDELAKIIYLTQGQLGSDLDDWPKFGIAEKLIIQALVKFTGRSAKELKTIITKKGDVGDAVEFILSKRIESGKEYSLDLFTSKTKKKKRNDKKKQIDGRTENSEKLDKSLLKNVNPSKNNKTIISSLDIALRKNISTDKTHSVREMPKKGDSNNLLSSKKIITQNKGNLDLLIKTKNQNQNQNQNQKMPPEEKERNRLPPKYNKKQYQYQNTNKSKNIRHDNKNSLEIPFLYAELRKLTLIKGSKSQEKKIDVLLGLLRRATPAAAKYIINIILSTLRIGLADMTIIDALAIAFTEDKKNRDEIERAYNVYPDLGKIGEILAKNGLNAIKKIKIQVGIPIRMMLASRLPYQQIHAKLGGKEFIAEYKYDGERVQVHKKGDKIILYSRRLKPITEQYPDIVEIVKTNVLVEEAIFEGELVAMDPFFEKMLPFQVMSARRRKYDIETLIKKIPVTLFCFDVLYIKKPKTGTIEEIKSSKFDGTLINFPLLKRRKILELIIKKADQITLAHHKLLKSTEEMVEYFKQAREAGAEGIMNKSIGPESIYRPGNRGFLWIKLKGLEGAKLLDTIDVLIIGASWGKGRRAGLLSTFFGAVYNSETGKFEFFTRIGSGFSDEDLHKFTEELKADILSQPPKDIVCKDSPDIWLKPRLIFEIMGDEITISPKSNTGVNANNQFGYSLRFPVIQRVRKDKSIFDITTTKEIIDLYQQQAIEN